MCLTMTYENKAVSQSAENKQVQEGASLLNPESGYPDK